MILLEPRCKRSALGPEGLLPRRAVPRPGGGFQYLMVLGDQRRTEGPRQHHELCIVGAEPQVERGPKDRSSVHSRHPVRQNPSGIIQHTERIIRVEQASPHGPHENVP